MQEALVDILYHMTDTFHFCSKENIMVMVTITLNPKMYKYKSFTQYEISINEVRRLCDTLSYRYVFVPELTAQGNIHYHVLARFHTRLQEITFVNKTKSKSPIFGFSKLSKPCSELSEVNRCLHYMFKDLELSRKILTHGQYKPIIINSSYLKNEDILGKYEEICKTTEQQEAKLQETLQEISTPSPQES